VFNFTMASRDGPALAIKAARPLAIPNAEREAHRSGKRRSRHIDRKAGTHPRRSRAPPPRGILRNSWNPGTRCSRRSWSSLDVVRVCAKRRTIFPAQENLCMSNRRSEWLMPQLPAGWGGPRRQIPVETPVAWTQWGRTFGVEDVRARPQTATNALESGWRERTGAE
jgi:hypothetical protein